MKGYVKNRTPEQIAFCKSLINRKPRKSKPSIKLPEPKTTDYMKNCIYWIEQFEETGERKEKAASALSSLECHIKYLRDKYNLS